MYTDSFRYDHPFAQLVRRVLAELIRSVRPGGVVFHDNGQFKLWLLKNKRENLVARFSSDLFAAEAVIGFHRPCTLELVEALAEGINAVLIINDESGMRILCSEDARMFDDVVSDIVQANKLLQDAAAAVETFERTGSVHVRPSYSR